jgi:hypothetical protein
MELLQVPARGHDLIPAVLGGVFLVQPSHGSQVELLLLDLLTQMLLFLVKGWQCDPRILLWLTIRAVAVKRVFVYLKISLVMRIHKIQEALCLPRNRDDCRYREGDEFRFHRRFDLTGAGLFRTSGQSATAGHARVAFFGI